MGPRAKNDSNMEAVEDVLSMKPHFYISPMNPNHVVPRQLLPTPQHERFFKGIFIKIRLFCLLTQLANI